MNTKKEFADVNKSVVSMMKAYRSSLDEMRNSLLATYNFDKSILVDFIVIDIKAIKELHEKETLDDNDKEEILSYRSFLKSHILDKGNIGKIDVMTDKFVLDLTYELKSKVMDIITTNEELIKYTREYRENLQELNKSKYETHKKYYEALKEEYEKETDKEKLRQIENEIDKIEYIEKYGFIEELVEPGVKNLFEKFFDEKRNSYIITKCFNKVKLFGLSKGLFSSLINIEEEFLPDYEEFNNLTLFLFTNYIAYANDTIPSTKEKVIKIANDLMKLKNNAFYTTEEKDDFIKVLKGVLDKFNEYRDYFKENNSSYKNNEVRAEMNKKKKEYLVNQMVEFGIPGYEEYLDDVNKLEEYYTDRLHDLEKDQIIKYKFIKEEDNEEYKDKMMKPKKKNGIEVINIDSNGKELQDGSNIEPLVARGLTTPVMIVADHDD